MRPSRFLYAVAPVLLMIAGCGDDDEPTYTYDTPDGKVTVKGSGDEQGKMTIEADGQKITYDTTGGTLKTTVTDKDGKTQTHEISTKVDLAEFEGFAYPNAKPQEEGSLSSNKTPEMTVVSGSFATPDKPETVAAHFKKLLPDAQVTAAGPMTMLHGKTPKGAQVSVQIMAGEDGGPTTLNVTLVKKG